ncbi:phosphotriesterase [Streptomyces sp. NPDC007264]|uniref:phosphotriesterase family protein n=1 Tax=Streptomyces sp. NPDC007264 TaxID=3364777 RepID=UPI0036D8DAD8
MSHVMSVLGPVEGEDLGTVLMHEHLTGGGTSDPVAQAAQRDSIEPTAIAVVEAVKQRGVGTFVDPCTPEIGRDPVLLREVSERTGVNIIVATGFHCGVDHEPDWLETGTEDALTERFVSEIVEGIGDSGVRAGVIKVGTPAGNWHGVWESAVRAAGRAQKETGVAVITHTSGSGGDHQLELLKEGGADPGRVLIGHVDHRHSTPAYLLKLIKQGATIGFDRVGLTVFLPDELRAGLAIGMVRSGHVDRLVISMDSVAVWLGKESPYLKGAPAPMTYLFDDFLPRLREMGLTAEEEEQIFRRTPRRLLCGD